MGKNFRVIVLFIIFILMFTMNSFASPAYYYANTYRVTISNVSKEDIEKIEVLAPLSGSKKEIEGLEYEEMLGDTIDYTGTEVVKCIKYNDVSNLKFKDNKCILKIYNIHDFQHGDYNAYFGGDVFLKIIKTNGEEILTETFCGCYLVDEFSSPKERKEAEEYLNNTAEFEIDLENGNGELLEVETVYREDNNVELQIKDNILITIIAVFIIVIMIIVKMKMNRK